MLVDGISLIEGSNITNLTVASGTAFPSLPDTGELFYLTSGAIGLYVYDGGGWELSGATLPSITTAGSYGGAATVPVISVAASGLVTSASDVSIQIVESQITDGTLLARSAGNEVISGTWSFNNPVAGATPTVSTHLATKNYVDGATVLAATTLATARDFSASGDAAASAVSFNGSANVDLALTLASVGAAGAKGSASSVPVFTTDGKGRVISNSDTAIAISTAQTTSGTFADARIAQSNVTQHQAALTIVESQITDGTLLARLAANETVTGTYQFNNPVTIATPASGSHATTKDYVDQAIAGLSWKSSVRVATTANITLSGTQTIDGIAVVVGNRVLVKNQSTQSQNGVYVVAAGAWTRASDFDSIAPIDEINSAAVFVQGGTTQADTAWTQTLNVTTVGTDSIAFTQFAGTNTFFAGSGMSLTANTFNVNTASASRIVVNVDDIDLAAVGSPITDSLRRITTDAYGRVTASSAVSSSDLSSILDATYVNVTGDTMTGNLVLTGDSQLLRPQAATTAGTPGLRIGTSAGTRTIEVLYNGTTSSGAYGAPAGSAVINTSAGVPLYFSTTDTARMVITSAGEIGIGTASPATPLHVYTSGVVPLTLTRASNVNVNGASGMVMEIGALVGTTPTTAVQYGAVLTNATSGYAYITSLAGGTLSERARFSDTLTEFRTNQTNFRRASDDTAPEYLVMLKSRGSNVSPSTVLANDALGQIQFYGRDASNDRPAATITAYVEGTPATGTVAGSLIFGTTPPGNSQIPVNRLIIDSTGKLHTAGSTDGPADINVRPPGSPFGSGSLSLAASPAGGGGASYLIMGNNDSGGTPGPSMIISANRILSFGVGSSFSGRAGGTFTEHMRIDSGNVGIGGQVPVAYGSGFVNLAVGSATGGGIFDSFFAGTRAMSMFTTAVEGRLDVFGASRPLNVYVNNAQRMSIGTNGDVTVAGAFFAATKSFLIDHPSKPGMKLRYGSLESPYHGVRLTGEAVVSNGVCRVALPDYISALVKQDGAQVQLTNHKHGKVLWVEDVVVAEGYFDVASETTDKDLKFFWSFTAVRKDVPDMIVEE